MDDIPKKIDNIEGMVKSLMVKLGLLTVEPSSSSSRVQNRLVETITEEQALVRLETEQELMRRVQELKGINLSSTMGMILEGALEERNGDHTLSFAPVRGRHYSPPFSAPITPTFQQHGIGIERGG